MAHFIAEKFVWFLLFGKDKLKECPPTLWRCFLYQIAVFINPPFWRMTLAVRKKPLPCSSTANQAYKICAIQPEKLKAWSYSYQMLSYHVKPHLRLKKKTMFTLWEHWVSWCIFAYYLGNRWDSQKLNLLKNYKILYKQLYVQSDVRNNK